MTVEGFCLHFSRVLSSVGNELRLELAAREIAAFFAVEPHEVGLFQVDSGGRTATFRWPPHSGSAIHIPLKTFISSLVSETAKERRGLVDNAFVKTPHLHMFEHGLTERDQRLPVQRIMSVPVANADGTLRWILQLSRKGQTLEESGPAFTEQDLQALERVAMEFARLDF